MCVDPWGGGDEGGFEVVREGVVRMKAGGDGQGEYVVNFWNHDLPLSILFDALLRGFPSVF